MMLSIKKAAQMSGMTEYSFLKAVSEGKILQCNGKVSEEALLPLLAEREKYMGLREFATGHSFDRFDGKNSRDLKALHDFLEGRDWFGIEHTSPGGLISGSGKEHAYFVRAEAGTLAGKLDDFFENYGLSEGEKIDMILGRPPFRNRSCQYVREFLDNTMAETPITQQCTDFVSLVTQISDISKLSNEDVAKLLSQAKGCKTKEILLRFLNDLKGRRPVSYGSFARKAREVDAAPGYLPDVYLGIAKAVFNAEYIEEHDMIRKALDYHLFAEAWLYVALFFVLGWRAADVCRDWGYLELYKEGTAFPGINKETLYEDILHDRIPDATYASVCRYCIAKVEASGRLPSKIANYDPPPLIAVITPELHTFYGLLTLIAESHMLRSGDGYMRPERYGYYQNRMMLRDFWGKEFWENLGGRNLQSRRLNKDSLQGVEWAARKNGLGGLMANSIAAFMRNHIDMDTIRAYIRDHNLTGESADTVLFFMMERGVFGFEPYQAVILSYPEAFRRMNLSEQNRIISMMGITPLQMEELLSINLASQKLEERFMAGDDDAALQILKAMFEISQNRGKAKEEGIHCMLRALGKACPHPQIASCVGEGCGEAIVTRYGYRPLVEALASFRMKAEAGDQKARTVYEKILLPRYKSVINALFNEKKMSGKERMDLDKVTREVLYDHLHAGDRA